MRPPEASGRLPNPLVMPAGSSREWRNWQTRTVEGRVPFNRGGGSSPPSRTTCKHPLTRGNAPATAVGASSRRGRDRRSWTHGGHEKSGERVRGSLTSLTADGEDAPLIALDPAEVDAEYRAAGLEPLAPYTRADEERECRCVECGTRRWVKLRTLRRGGIACRWCHGWRKWGPWSEEARERASSWREIEGREEALRRIRRENLAPLTPVGDVYEPRRGLPLVRGDARHRPREDEPGPPRVVRVRSVLGRARSSGPRGRARGVRRERAPAPRAVPW